MNILQQRILRHVWTDSVSDGVSIDSQRHWSFITYRNKILSVGRNSFKTHPKTIKYGHRTMTIHSEFMAILKFPRAPKYLAECEMYNLRLHKDNSLALSKPCVACTQLIKDYGFRGVNFTNSNGDFDYLQLGL